MAARRKKTVAKEEKPVIEEEKILIKEEKPVDEVPKKKKTPSKKVETPKKVEKIEPKYKIGSVVYISQDAESDLNGFKLFPQYKKATYTVEAYDETTEVYSLRRLNLIISLKEEHIVSPEERAHDSLNRMRF